MPTNRKVKRSVNHFRAFEFIWRKLIIRVVILPNAQSAAVFYNSISTWEPIGNIDIESISPIALKTQVIRELPKLMSTVKAAPYNDLSAYETQKEFYDSNDQKWKFIKSNKYEWEGYRVNGKNLDFVNIVKMNSRSPTCMELHKALNQFLVLETITL